MSDRLPAFYADGSGYWPGCDWPQWGLTKEVLYSLVDNPNIGPEDAIEVDKRDALRRYKGIPSIWD